MRLRLGMRSLLLVIACGTACDRRPQPAADSAVDTVPAVPERRPPPWVTDLGPLLVVPSDSENTGVVVFPETPSAQLISSTPLTLLSPAGDPVRVRAALLTDAPVCDDAPTIRLQGDTANVWSVGLNAGSLAPIRMDSIESLPSADSARVAVDLARVASTLVTTSGSRFAGLPFVVLSARRFAVPGGETVVALLARRVPQEASPLQEHTLVVADRANAAEPYRASYHLRSEGSEESVDHYEVLSAVRAGDATFLLLAIERATQTVYQILERRRIGGWRERWERTLAC